MPSPVHGCPQATNGPQDARLPSLSILLVEEPHHRSQRCVRVCVCLHDLHDARREPATLPPPSPLVQPLPKPLPHAHAPPDVADAEIINQLSTPLRKETLLHMYRPIISNNPLFSIIDDLAFRDGLLRALRPMLVSTQEVLMRQGSRGEEAFFLAHGAVSVYFDPVADRAQDKNKEEAARRARLALAASAESMSRLINAPAKPTPLNASRVDSISAESASAEGIELEEMSESPKTSADVARPRISKMFRSGTIYKPDLSDSEDGTQASDFGPVINEVRGGRLDSIVGEVCLFTASKMAARSTHSKAADRTVLPPRTATVVAKTNCECYAIAAQVFIDLCKRHPQAKAVFSALAESRRRKTDTILGTMDATNRILSLRGQFGDAEREAQAATMFQTKMRGIMARKHAAAKAESGPLSIPGRLKTLEGGQKRLEEKLDSVLQLLSARHGDSKGQLSAPWP